MPFLSPHIQPVERWTKIPLQNRQANRKRQTMVAYGRIRRMLDRDTAKIIAYNLQKIARQQGKAVIAATTHSDLARRPKTQRTWCTNGLAKKSKSTITQTLQPLNAA
jgi:hypothetical protein